MSELPKITCLPSTVVYRPDREFWRYLFAGMAMQALVGDDEAQSRARADCQEGSMARWAVTQADALLAELELEREKGEGDG